MRYVSLHRLLWPFHSLRCFLFFPTWLKVSTQSSTILSFVERFDEIVKSGQSMEFPFDDRNFAYFLPITSNSYYTYHGSLTTAPYNEAVTWVVFKQPMPITESQVRLIDFSLNFSDFFHFYQYFSIFWHFCSFFVIFCSI